MLLRAPIRASGSNHAVVHEGASVHVDALCEHGVIHDAAGEFTAGAKIGADGMPSSVTAQRGRRRRIANPDCRPVWHGMRTGFACGHSE